VKGGLHVENNEKLTGEERRNYIVQLLKNEDMPITGQKIAELTGVSRQVIVTDVALLKASDEPIIATNRGYLYMRKKESKLTHKRIVICKHTPEQTAQELNTIVDCGVTVENVIVEHPIYGDLTGSLMLKSRYDVEQFTQALTSKDASLLSVLTDGLHLHTLVADSVAKLDAACEQLDQLGILYRE